MQTAKDQSGDAIKFEPFAPPSTAELDVLIPGYQFLEFIDSGGMGAVYKAVQKSLNRTVAVKLLPQMHRNKATFAERFRREAEALARLNHPHIVAVYDFGETPDGLLYFIMEFVDGTDVQKMIQASGKLSGEYAGHVHDGALIMIHSPRAASILAGFAAGMTRQAPLAVAAISTAAAEPLTGFADRIEIAAAPDSPALFSALVRLLFG